MAKKLSYLGGHTTAGSSVYFSGWGEKKKPAKSSVGLLAMAPAVPEDAEPVLIKKGSIKPPKQSKLVRKLRKDAAKRLAADKAKAQQ